MRGLACVLVVFASTGCINSLREPGSIPSAPSTPGVTVSRSSGVEAQGWFEQGTLESVRLAEQAWLADVSESRRVPSLIGLTRTRIWLATHENGTTARRLAAGSAVESSQWCAMASPEDPQCDYWLALALGVQARERRSTALDALPRIVELLESVVARSPDLDHAGAHRVLGLLYLRAPGWPAGPGDPDKGLSQARLAIERAPGYPPNQLCFAEALESGGDSLAALETYRAALESAEKWTESGEAEVREWIAEAREGLSRVEAE